jgi:hypothetical protein
MKRRSLIPSRRSTHEGPLPQAAGLFCGGCYTTILNPGLARTGKVLEGTRWFTKSDLTLMNPLGRTAEARYAPTERRIGVVSYRKCYLCPRCASCYKCEVINDRPVPIVIVDPWLPPAREQRLSGAQLRSDEAPITGRRTPPAFNTKVTQGRKGARV